MATENATPPEGFTKAESPQNSNDYDTEFVDRPDVGDLLQGVLLAIKPERGQYETTLLEIRLTQPYGDCDEDELVAVWSTTGIDDALEENDVNRGDEIALAVEDTFESDGDTRRNYAVYVKD